MALQRAKWSISDLPPQKKSFTKNCSVQKNFCFLTCAVRIWSAAIFLSTRQVFREQNTSVEMRSIARFKARENSYFVHLVRTPSIRRRAIFLKKNWGFLLGFFKQYFLIFLFWDGLTHKGMHNWKHDSSKLRAAVAVVCGYPSSSKAHLLKLHQLQSPRHRPVNSEMPGCFSLIPSLLAAGPLPTPWRAESPGTNKEIYRGWSLYRKKRLHPVLHIGSGRVEGKQTLRKETGHCGVFTFPIYYL